MIKSIKYFIFKKILIMTLANGPKWNASHFLHANFNKPTKWAQTRSLVFSEL